MCDSEANLLTKRIKPIGDEIRVQDKNIFSNFDVSITDPRFILFVCAIIFNFVINIIYDHSKRKHDSIYPWVAFIMTSINLLSQFQINFIVIKKLNLNITLFNSNLIFILIIFFSPAYILIFQQLKTGNENIYYILIEIIFVTSLTVVLIQSNRLVRQGCVLALEKDANERHDSLGREDTGTEVSNNVKSYIESKVFVTLYFTFAQNVYSIFYVVGRLGGIGFLALYMMINFCVNLHSSYIVTQIYRDEDLKSYISLTKNSKSKDKQFVFVIVLNIFYVILSFMVFAKSRK